MRAGRQALVRQRLERSLPAGRAGYARDGLMILGRSLAAFRRNQGLLLAGAVAYYALLSLVPLFAVLLVALAHLVDQERLLDTITVQLEVLLPGQAAEVVSQVRTFLAHREVTGTLGLAVLLLFSSTAFTVLENAMLVIFHHRAGVHRRHPLVSAIIPYLFICLLGVGLLVVTAMTALLQALAIQRGQVLGASWVPSGVAAAALYLLGVVGLGLMLTAFYMVMPVGRVAFRPAARGAAVATVLWEISRHVVVWYLTTLSMVNVVYGSLATAVVILLTLELAALIVLFGAQVVAEVDRGRITRAHVGSRQD